MVFVEKHEGDVSKTHCFFCRLLVASTLDFTSFFGGGHCLGTT